MSFPYGIQQGTLSSTTAPVMNYAFILAMSKHTMTKIKESERMSALEGGKQLEEGLEEEATKSNKKIKMLEGMQSPASNQSIPN